MFQSLTIKNFRGVASGEIDPLFPMSVIVGANNSGKSTCLESLYLLATGLNGVRHVMQRRGWFGEAAIESTFNARGAEILARMPAREGDSPMGAFFRANSNAVPKLDDVPAARERGLKGDLNAVELRTNTPDWTNHSARVLFDSRGRQWGVYTDRYDPAEPPRVAFLDTAAAKPAALTDALSLADAAGEATRGRLLDAFRAIDPEVRDVRVIRRGGRWVPYAVYANSSVPLHVMGAGAIRLFEIAAHTAATANGLLLLEEPECFLHPAMFATVSRLLWHAVEQKTQVFVSTHSAALFNALCPDVHSPRERTKQFGLHFVKRERGQLTAETYPEGKRPFLSDALTALLG